MTDLEGGDTARRMGGHSWKEEEETEIEGWEKTELVRGEDTARRRRGRLS